jgi:four helix bundle protein
VPLPLSHQNIAEGQGRGGGVEFARFLKIAYGSLRELETQFEIAHRLCYLDEAQLGEAIEAANEVGRLIKGLLKSAKPPLR